MNTWITAKELKESGYYWRRTDSKDRNPEVIEVTKCDEGMRFWVCGLDRYFVIYPDREDGKQYYRIYHPDE